MGKIFTVSILGCGSRGHYTYGKCMYEFKDKFKIACVCDNDPEKIRLAQDAWGIAEKDCFLDSDEFLKSLGFEHIKNTVREKFQVELEPEVRFLGTFSNE